MENFNRYNHSHSELNESFLLAACVIHLNEFIIERKTNENFLIHFVVSFFFSVLFFLIDCLLIGDRFGYEHSFILFEMVFFFFFFFIRSFVRLTRVYAYICLFSFSRLVFTTTSRRNEINCDRKQRTFWFSNSSCWIFKSQVKLFLHRFYQNFHRAMFPMIFMLFSVPMNE